MIAFQLVESRISKRHAISASRIIRNGMGLASLIRVKREALGRGGWGRCQCALADYALTPALGGAGDAWKAAMPTTIGTVSSAAPAAMRARLSSEIFSILCRAVSKILLTSVQPF